jgi:hypothetical protein
MAKQISSSALTIFQEKAFKHMTYSSTGDKTHFSLITRTGAHNPWYEKEGLWKQYCFSLFWF